MTYGHSTLRTTQFVAENRLALSALFREELSALVVRGPWSVV
jgi:hypothetical protein